MSDVVNTENPRLKSLVKMLINKKFNDQQIVEVVSIVTALDLYLPAQLNVPQKPENLRFYGR